MDELRFKIGKEFCISCSMALRKFLGHLDGVEDVSAEGGRLVIRYDSGKIGSTDLFKVSSDSLEKLGYRAEKDDGGG